MWGKKKENAAIKFFFGDSVQNTATHSLYGLFIKAISSIFTEENIDVVAKYKIPTVVVIGAESSGKSSLLENITKCPIFPRNARICTKQPIHLKLQPSNNNSPVSYTYTFNNHKKVSSQRIRNNYE